MKTLVVLSALASVALAAPSFFGKEHTRTNSEPWPETIKRDKKSPHGYFYAETSPIHFAGPPVHIAAEAEGPSATGRSFGHSKKHFFKPTIIKKHNGYHVYRDSDEERAQADPRENCSKQVNFKFCDGHSTDGALARSANDETNIHTDDMESSIKMAKEAIESIERDLKNKEQAPKSAGWKQREAESQAELHGDIEVARKALDQLQKNFGNLESMSLKIEPAHEIHDDKIKRNGERMAQWKENIETIQTNIDVGSNVEGAFGQTDQQMDVSHLTGVDTTSFMRNSEKQEVKQHASNVDTITKERHAGIDKIEKTDDMKISATNINEAKIVEKAADPVLDVKIKLLEQKNIENSHGKNSELETTKVLHEGAPVSMKMAEHEKTNFDVKTTIRMPENNKVSSLGQENVNTKLKTVASETEGHLHKSNEKGWKPLTAPKSAMAIESNIDHLHAEDKKSKDLETTLKSAEHEHVLKTTLNSPALIENLGSTNHLKNADNIDLNMRWSPVTNVKMENEPTLKFAGESHDEHLRGMHVHTMHHHTEPAVASSIHVDTMHGHGHGHTHMHLLKGHDHFKHHEKSADTEELIPPALQMNLPDFTGKSALDNLMQWTHKQDGGRSAYGSYGAGSYGAGGYGAGGYGAGGLNIGASGGGGGAVGVFPSAHVGGCAVPLLLSCSPSVVSGSLAKSGYGHGLGYGAAPAYKAAEENNHNKRDIKKTNEITQKISHKTTIKQKPKITEKKL